LGDDLLGTAWTVDDSGDARAHRRRSTLIAVGLAAAVFLALALAGLYLAPAIIIALSAS
jgi:hypothetical protein